MSDMTDLFISYARADQPFVRSLFVALEQRRRQAWVDWEGIAPSAAWMAEIEAAIDAADTFLFVISPASLVSPVCAQELDHAVQRNKRLIPVVRRDAAGQAVPPSLARLNWIFLREQDVFVDGVDTLIEALDADLDHVRLHTRYLVRAAEWKREKSDASYTLRGRDLAEAETWLAHSGGKDPRPSSLHNRYILDSRRVTTRRQRIGASAVAAGLLVAATLGLLAWQQSAAKRQNQQRSIANQLVGESRLAREQRDDGLHESVQLAAEAMRRFAALDEHSLAADQQLRSGLALLPAPPAVTELPIRGETRAAAFSATGTYLAVATALGDITVRNVAAGTTQGSWTMPLEAGDDLRAIAVDDAGTRVAIWRYTARGTSRLSLWDVVRATELAACDREGDFSGRGARLDAAARWWIGDEVWHFPDCRGVAVWPPSADSIRQSSLSADGSRMAASVRQRGERQRWIEIRDAASGAEIQRWRHDDALAQLWFIDRDRRLAAVAFSGKHLWVSDIDSAAPVSETELAEPALAISGDGKTVVTAGRDASIVRLRSAATGVEQLRLVHSSQVRAAAFSPGDDSLTTLTAKHMWRWQLGAVRNTVGPGSVATRLLATRAGPGATESWVEGLGLKALKDLGDVKILAATPCPDESRVAVTVGSTTRGGWRARTELFTLPGGERLASFDLMATLGAGMRGLDDRAAALLACSTDGRLLALPARDAAVVREIDSGRVMARLLQPGLRFIAFAPGGEYAATAGTGPIRVWQLSSSAEVARLPDDAPVSALAFSDDGRYLVSAGAGGVETFLWQPQHLVNLACSRLPHKLTAARWGQLFPEASYVATCADAR